MVTCFKHNQSEHSMKLGMMSSFYKGGWGNSDKMGDMIFSFWGGIISNKSNISWSCMVILTSLGKE